MILIKPSHEILTPIDGYEIARRIELAGRVCYKSESKITDLSAELFVQKIKLAAHHSVLEHVSVSVRIICDRGVSHEIVRHRLASYSQESTRYCNYKGGVTFIIPPWIDIEPGEYTDDDISERDYKPDVNVWYRAMLESETYYQSLLFIGWTPQQARAVLPNSLKTELIMTANIREWLHVFRLRCSMNAHPQMREIMIPIKNEFKRQMPFLFADEEVPQ